MSSLLLTGGKLYDGSGNPPLDADLLIRDRKIAQVEPAGKVVFPGVDRQSLHGLSVSPGWIDVHAHSDASLLAAPEAFGKISQGITTEISGNCGLSAFPILSDEVREHLRGLYAVYDLNPGWTDFRSYAAALSVRRPAINTAFLCGHNTLRASIAGYRQRELSGSDRDRMRSVLTEMLRQGALGISTGLLYTPGCFADETELQELLAAAAAESGIYATHLRNEGDRLEEAVREALRLAEHARIPLQISHLKTALPRNWHKLDSVLDLLTSARQRGIRVSADRYPYTFSQTSLSIVLPPPYDTMTDRAIQTELRDHPDAYEQTLRQLAGSGRDWSKVILCQSGAPSARGLTGCSIRQAAAERGVPPAELVMMILREDSPGSMAAFGGMSEDNLDRILAQDWVCCGTDETARPADSSLGKSHPRGFGAFPRFITRLRESGMPMERIIHRITALPSRIFGLSGRGWIQPGMAADLVIFAEDQLDSAADFRCPHTPAAGIRQVYVNGIAAYDGNTRTVTARPGEILLKK